jgi:hypothetical protein
MTNPLNHPAVLHLRILRDLIDRAHRRGRDVRGHQGAVRSSTESGRIQSPTSASMATAEAGSCRRKAVLKRASVTSSPAHHLQQAVPLILGGRVDEDHPVARPEHLVRRGPARRVVTSLGGRCPVIRNVASGNSIIVSAASISETSTCRPSP